MCQLQFICNRKFNPEMFTKLKSMLSQGLVYENRAYFENSGPNWSKLGSLIGLLISIHMVYFIFGKN